MTNFFLAFIPIFVAVDAIGVLPIFISLTQHLSKKEKNKIVVQSLWTAIILAVGFIFLGKSVFSFLGITMSDFMIAGGIILFCISILDLLQSTKDRRAPFPDSGVVPLGTPLIVGPAVLTTSLMLVDQHGVLLTLASVTINILITGLFFISSDKLMRVLGQAGSRALSKVFSLLLATIAIMMIRKGVIKLILTYTTQTT